MMRELAQAIHDLAQTGRLSEESEENIAFLLEPPEPVSDVAVTASDDDSTPPDDKPPAKSAASTAKSGGSK